MRTLCVMLSLLSIVSLFPAASAETFCPEHNPSALANCSVMATVEDREVFVPEATLVPQQQCIIGPYCVPYVLPGPINWESFGEAPLPYSVGYVEVTALCPPSGANGIHVSLDTTTDDGDGNGDATKLCRVSWNTTLPSNQVVA